MTSKMRANKLLSLAQKNSAFIPIQRNAIPLPLQNLKQKDSTANEQNADDFKSKYSIN